ncbi:BBF_HP2_G0002380.mRNA.1.CDS.1 [Saccharomyces cerevisiae]|nr:BBF_HP2_G0002380.mRNA.1.CDS.1 [Saccharomyces cerevisiae]CAI6392947.1 BBF_HP1_G0002350.mRNA.1.CDS.1 [Saccharomyces cerevisiae]CAI6393585.1 BBF_HP2_G0002380.mRNA.1.CDS.1 [Saccharomyces cerevisiae]
METILQPKARPFESLKRKRFREWLRPSTAHGSLLHSDTLDLRDFAKPNPADTFSNLDSGHCPLVTTPIKYECPDGKSSFFRGDTKFETLFSNRKFYEFKDNLKRGLKKIRHGRNGHQSEKRCPVVEETKKSVSDNLDKPDNNTPCFNRFHTNSKEFETQFDHSNRSQNSDKAYLDNESCWNLSEKFIPFNNLKYEDLKHSEENLQSLVPATFTPIESNESLDRSDSTRGTKRSIRNDSSDTTSEKRLCLKQYSDEPESDHSMESTPSIYITKEVQERIEALSSTDSFLIEKVDFPSNKIGSSASDYESDNEYRNMDEDSINDVTTEKEGNVVIPDSNTSTVDAMEKPTEVSSALKDDTLDKDIDDASSSYSDDVETTFEPVESEELSDLSDTSSSGSSKIYTIPTFRGLTNRTNISQILSKVGKADLSQDNLTHLIKSHQKKKRCVNFRNKRFYDAFNPYVDNEEDAELSDSENISEMDTDLCIKDRSTSSVRFDENSRLLIYKKSKKLNKDETQSGYSTIETRSILKTKMNSQHDEESQRASKCDTVGVAQFLHYFQYTEYKRQRNEAENYRLRGEQLSKYYSEEYPLDFAAVECEDSVNDKSEIILSMRATERNIGRQLKGISSQGAQIISLDEDVF